MSVFVIYFGVVFLPYLFYNVYGRDFENKRKKIASEDRIRDKEKEHSLETLLHTIVSERRKKELDEENNLVTRDRLGFNDESFKGEEYHGQKRKKNKV